LHILISNLWGAYYNTVSHMEPPDEVLSDIKCLDVKGIILLVKNSVIYHITSHNSHTLTFHWEM